MSDASKLIRILTVDDHPLLRDGIASLVNSEADMRIVAEASGGREAIERFREHRPDITLMDLRMPDMDGIEAMAKIIQQYPAARIIVLTTYSGDALIIRALKAGAQGYLLKGQLRKELLDTIRSVHAGRKRISSEVAQQMANHAVDSLLTLREIDVLQRSPKGMQTKWLRIVLPLPRTP